MSGINGTVFTVGHSTRSIEEFVEILRAAGVAQLIDVRSIPRSRTNPQFNLDILPATLAEYQINHIFLKELGGRRPRQAALDPRANNFWQNQSFHNYADYATTAPFQAGLQDLLMRSASKSSAIMCAEAVWWRCHRRIIADYLLYAGRPVIHLMARDRSQSAKMTGVAVDVGSILLYPKDSDANVMKGSESVQET